MKKVYIITWAKKSPLGFDFNEDYVFSTREEAVEEITKELLDEDTEYIVKEVPDVFMYLYSYLGNTTDLIYFTDDPEDLEKVYDFFENVRDEKLVEQYLGQALSSAFFTYDRTRWLDRKISILEYYRNKEVS